MIALDTRGEGAQWALLSSELFLNQELTTVPSKGAVDTARLTGMSPYEVERVLHARAPTKLSVADALAFWQSVRDIASERRVRAA